MISMKVKDIQMMEGIRYCAVCRYDGNENTFSYYSVDHETKKGFIKRVVKTIKHEFNEKPEII
jgi:hypothetical protein